MKKYLSNLLPILLFIMLITTSWFPTYATQTKIYDQANLLTTEEASNLETRMGALVSQYNMDVVIVTTDSMDGKSSRVYADDFYDQGGFGVGEEASGLLLLINMEDREVYISTCGQGINYFTDARIDSILDHLSPALGNQNYHLACETFLDQVEAKLTAGIPSNQYTEEEKGFRFSPLYTVIYLAVAILVSLISCFAVKKRYKNPTSISGKAYLNQSSVRYSRREDTFLGAHTTRHKRESSNSSSGGGRSSTHSSSSGRSHGGGGRSF